MLLTMWPLRKRANHSPAFPDLKRTSTSAMWRIVIAAPRGKINGSLDLLTIEAVEPLQDVVNIFTPASRFSKNDGYRHPRRAHCRRRAVLRTKLSGNSAYQDVMLLAGRTAVAWLIIRYSPSELIFAGHSGQTSRIVRIH